MSNRGSTTIAVCADVGTAMVVVIVVVVVVAVVAVVVTFVA